MEADKKLVDLGVKDLWTASSDGDEIWGSPTSPWTTPNLPHPQPPRDVISLEELEKGILSAPELSDDSLSPSLVPPSQSSPSLVPPSQSSPSLPQSSPSLIPPSQSSPLLSPSHLSPSLVPPSQSSPSHSVETHHNMLPMPFIGPPHHIMGHPMGHHPLYGRIPFPHRPPHPHLLPRLPPGMPLGMPLPHHQQYHRSYDHRHGDRSHGDNRDQYSATKKSEMLCDLKEDGSGFMNQKEKDWVIKVQLLQLHTTTPTIDDYYYHQYIKKKHDKAHNEEGVVAHSSDTPLTLPPPISGSNEDKKDKDCPLNFKDSLGKVSYGSISAPRKTIDTGSPSLTSPRQDRGKRQYLLTIENMFIMVMKLEEMDTISVGVDKLSLDESSSSDGRGALVKDIFAYTGLSLTCGMEEKTDGEKFCRQLLAIKKGKKVFQRCLPYFDEGQSKAVLWCLTKSIKHLIKKDAIDNMLMSLLPAISGIILLLPFTDILNHVTILSRLVSSECVHHTFFFSYTSSFVTRGKELIRGQPNDEIIQWESLLNHFDNP